ncbi:hypothetical protein EMIT019CA3_20373 [Bacillus pseudomycoides]
MPVFFCVFIPLLMNGNTSISKFRKRKEGRWGMEKTPLIKVSLYDKIKRKNKWW